MVLGGEKDDGMRREAETTSKIQIKHENTAKTANPESDLKTADQTAYIWEKEKLHRKG